MPWKKQVWTCLDKYHEQVWTILYLCGFVKWLIKLFQKSEKILNYICYFFCFNYGCFSLLTIDGAANTLFQNLRGFCFFSSKKLKICNPLCNKRAKKHNFLLFSNKILDFLLDSNCFLSIYLKLLANKWFI